MAARPDDGSSSSSAATDAPLPLDGMSFEELETLFLEGAMPEIEPPPEPDLFRDTPVRLLGYANEVGEAFRPILPRFVGPSYAIATLYMVADTADKGWRAWEVRWDAQRRKGSR